MSRIKKCRNQSCNVQVRQLRNKTTGKFAPIEVEPSDDGNVSVTGDIYEIVPVDERALHLLRGFKLYKNHFATCAFARSFAKRIAARKKIKEAKSPDDLLPM